MEGNWTIYRIKNTTVREIYFEADEWLQEVFKEYDCFTILGI